MGDVIAGPLPPRALALVAEWANLHHDELLTNWERARRNEPLRDPAYFARVEVDSEAGTIAWPDGLDMAPEPLYSEARRHLVGAARATS